VWQMNRMFLNVVIEKVVVKKFECRCVPRFVILGMASCNLWWGFLLNKICVTGRLIRKVQDVVD